MTPHTTPTGLGLTAGAFLLPLIFIPAFADPAEAPRWAVLSIAPFAACFVPSRFTVGHALGVLFLSWAAFTLQWSSGPYEGMGEMWKLVCLAGLFRLGSAMPTLRPVFLAAGLAFAVNSAIVFAQWMYEWDGIVQMRPPGGLFMNKNFVAEPAVLVLVGLLAYRDWWLAGALLPCIGMTTARGAVLALGFTWATALRSRVLAAGLVLAVVAGGLYWWHVRTYNDSGRIRLVMWSAVLSDMTPFGHGLGSFYGRFPQIAPQYDTLDERPNHLHNDPLEIAYETGPGILILLGFLAYCLAGSSRPARLVLVAFLAESCLSFPMWFAVPSALAALCAGHLCRDRPSLHFHLAVGRIRLQSMAERLEWD